MPATSLDGRLLCASGAAYYVDPSRPTMALDPGNVFIQGAGFLAPPAAMAAGPLDTDACLVGETVDGPVLAIRGTLRFDIHSFPTLRDWLTDFETNPVAVNGFPGFVHEGFHDAWLALEAGVTGAIQSMANPPSSDRPLLITGHSKGGAVAALAAWILHSTAGLPVKVVTFAAPKPGDVHFRLAYQGAGISHVRYEYNNDIVPHLPLSDGGFVDVLSRLPFGSGMFDDIKRFDYQPVGVLQYIDHNLRILEDDSTLRAERDLLLAIEVIRLRFAQIAMDHSIDCGSGYMSAINRTGVCPGT